MSMHLCKCDSGFILLEKTKVFTDLFSFLDQHSLLHFEARILKNLPQRTLQGLTFHPSYWKLTYLLDNRSLEQGVDDAEIRMQKADDLTVE